VKLENLLYDEHDVLRVADWGLAQFCEPGAHRRCLPVGTGARTRTRTHARVSARTWLRTAMRCRLTWA
jgi:hypothetical protein